MRPHHGYHYENFTKFSCGCLWKKLVIFSNFPRKKDSWKVYVLSALNDCYEILSKVLTLHADFLSSSLRVVKYGGDMIRSWNLLQRCYWRYDIWWLHQIANQLQSYSYTYWHIVNRFLMYAKIKKICHLQTSNGFLWWKL